MAIQHDPVAANQIDALFDVLQGNERFHLRRGDVAWTGVGASHAFCHTGDVPFRWIETQAPQFPAQNGTRNYSDWDELRAGNCPLDQGSEE